MSAVVPLRRDLQLALMEGYARPVGPIPRSCQQGLNHDLIRTVAPLYLTGSVLDVTYGRGAWWKSFHPTRFAKHDLALDDVDFRHLPEADRSWDTVCFDPPYIPRHGSRRAPTEALEQFRVRYGLDTSRSLTEMLEMHREGLSEAARVARHWVLVKCSDYVAGRSFHPGHIYMIGAAADAGLRLHDLVVLDAGRPGPGDAQILEPKRCRRSHSYLLVFRVPRKRKQA